MDCADPEEVVGVTVWIDSVPELHILPKAVAERYMDLEEPEDKRHQ